jgi:[ribosomal protein S5]-alanine N-acetyltransferase
MGATSCDRTGRSASSRAADYARNCVKPLIDRGLGSIGLRLVRSDSLAPRLERALRGTPLPRPAAALSDGVAGLRQLERADLPALSAASADAGVRLMAGWPSPFTLFDAERWLDDRAALHEAGMALDFAVAESETDAFAGLLQLQHFEWNDRRASLGLWLAPQARGRGLMTSGVGLMVDWVFREGLLERLEYLVRSDNEPSLALAERCGFRREGLLRSCLVRDRERRDAVLLAALRSDWLAERQ